MSQREAARHFNISRDSVSKMMAFPVPRGYRRTAPVKRPKLDGYTVIIDGWLEGDREVHRKQRHTAKRVMQASNDTFLGWASGPARGRKRVDFYVRQLNDYKTSANISSMNERRLALYVEICAEALTRAHARSSSTSANSGYQGKSSTFDKAMGSFAIAYADQNKRDYEAFAAAAAEGRMEVSSGI